jgi:hypothetical protein
MALYLPLPDDCSEGYGLQAVRKCFAMSPALAVPCIIFVRPETNAGCPIQAPFLGLSGIMALDVPLPDDCSEGYGLQAVRKCFAMNPALAAEGRFPSKKDFFASCEAVPFVESLELMCLPTLSSFAIAPTL